MDNTRKIKLFVDAHPFDKEFQGTRTFLKGLYEQMALLSNNIEFYFGACNTENLASEFANLKNCHFVKYNTSHSYKRIYIEIPALIKKYGIDIAHFQYVAPFKKYCPYIVTTHDILFNDFKSEFSFLFRFSRNFLFKYSIKHADIKTTVSDYSRERIALHYGLDKKEIHLVPNGVSDVFYEPYDKQESQRFIEQSYGISNFVLYISRIEPRKNNLQLLKAYLQTELYKKNIALVFIGKTSISLKALNDAIKEMPGDAKSKFFHIEQVSNQDLLRFYQAAELFVYPSKAEGFGIPPLEAAALKVPVLCSNKTAMSDYRFFNGNFFDPDNCSELLEKLNAALAGTLTQDLDEVARQVKQNYNWTKSATTMIGLIENLMKTKTS